MNQILVEFLTQREVNLAAIGIKFFPKEEGKEGGGGGQMGF